MRVLSRSRPYHQDWSLFRGDLPPTCDARYCEACLNVRNHARFRGLCNCRGGRSQLSMVTSSCTDFIVSPVRSRFPQCSSYSALDLEFISAAASAHEEG